MDKISAIVKTEEKLEIIIGELTENTSVAHHEISIQGSPKMLIKRFGSAYVDPIKIQESDDPPTQEPFLKDDYGWILGFSFSLPVFICIVLGVFLIGDVRSYYDNMFYGILGAIIGSIIGLILFRHINKQRQFVIKQQENLGGYVLWINVTTEDQKKQVLEVLNQYGAEHILT